MLSWVKRVGWIVAGLGLLWAALAWGLPPLARWQAQKQLSALLGRVVTVDEVSIEPQRLALEVRGLRVGGLAPTDEPLLQVARLRVDAELASLWQRAPVVSALEVERPALRLARTGEGRYDIDDLIARFTPAPSAEPATEPQRFAVYNLQVRDASLRFDDRPVQRVHQVEALRLDLPFVSNLPTQLEVKVEPRLAFRIGSTQVDTGAQATPFASNRVADLHLTLDRLDLAPYLPYLPASLPVRVQRGGLAGALSLHFAMPARGPQTLTLSGHLDADQVTLADREGAELVRWDRLALVVGEVSPLERRVALRSLQLDGSRWQVQRTAAGALNWAALATPAAPAGTEAPAAAPAGTQAPAAARGAGAPPPAAGTPWQLSLARFGLGGGTVVWRDEAVSPRAELQLADIQLAVDDIAWPLAHALPLKLSAALRGPGDAPLGGLSLEGRAGLDEARVAFELSPLTLAAFNPYLAPVWVPQLSGELAARGELSWAAAAPAVPAADKAPARPARADQWQLRLARLTLDKLKLAAPRQGLAADSPPGSELASFRQLSLEQLVVDPVARSLSLDRLSLLQPSIGVARRADGRWNVRDWLAVPATSAPAPTAAAADRAPPWRIAVKDLQLQGGQIAFSDAQAGPGAAGEPLRTRLAGLRLNVQNLAWQGERSTAAMRLQLATRIGPAPTADDPQPASGSIDWKGQLGLGPVQARGALRIETFPVAHFEPYVGAQLPLALVRAHAGYQGELNLQQAPAGWTVGARGDVLLADVELHARDAAGAVGDELLNWQRLALDGVAFSMSPGARPQLSLREAALSDFYSRLVITEQGRFNLQDVAAAPASADTAASAPAGATAPAASAAPAPASTPASAPGGGLPIDLDIGATRLVNGRIDFTDRFVRPNYSAALSELNGRLGGFRSGSREMAALELRGRAAGTALLDISGQLNPTAEPLALDIRARATDLELAPLSPYAGKYAGYAIERGKLSMDVAYKIDPDGKLDAKNQVILNQLTFGDRIESPQATRLPVLLAVALLKDRNGVIDINLPVSGSLSDPQFSVGGIVLKVIINLLTKALTAPFALLAGGGGDDLSLVEFQPGTAAVAASGTAALDKVAKALAERPALKMTVTGSADPASEAEAWRREAVEARLLAERRRELARAGGAAPASPSLAPADRERLLRLVYKQSELPNKPKNLVGMTKDVSPAEMEALLKAGLRPSEDTMRELALQRGLAVRDALIERGLPSERLFLAAPKLRAAAEGEAGWTPRVQLSLSTN